MHDFIVHKAWRRALLLRAMRESGNMQRIPLLVPTERVPDRAIGRVWSHSIRGDQTVPLAPPDTRSESIRAEGGLGLLSIYFHVRHSLDGPRLTAYVHESSNSLTVRIQGYIRIYR
jgi:hypothetical protein